MGQLFENKAINDRSDVRLEPEADKFREEIVSLDEPGVEGALFA